MTYQEALDWLYAQLPMFQRVGKAAYKADLTNTLALADLLGHPEQKFPTIHVAGTNGKGSTSHALAAVFQQAGYKTGLYTSPHLTDFRERVRVNGVMVSEEVVAQFVTQYQGDFTRIGLSFFEMTVGLAFHHFANECVDMAIIETGMGGRLDATNIITPELSIITNIGMDHATYLGNTLELIASEKAGIIKPGVPVVLGDQGPKSVRQVFEAKAAACASLLVFADNRPFTTYATDLKGGFQQKNLRTVAAALELLPQYNFTESAISDALQNVQKLTGLRGRWQQVQDSPRVICDTGHNTHALQETLPELQQLKGSGSLHMILGVVNDKDVAAMVTLLPPDARYYLCAPDVPRALPVAALQLFFDGAGFKSTSHPDVKSACAAALLEAQPSDTLFVGGSTFVVADFLK